MFLSGLRMVRVGKPCCPLTYCLHLTCGKLFPGLCQVTLAEKWVQCVLELPVTASHPYEVLAGYPVTVLVVANCQHKRPLLVSRENTSCRVCQLISWLQTVMDLGQMCILFIWDILYNLCFRNKHLIYDKGFPEHSGLSKTLKQHSNIFHFGETSAALPNPPGTRDALLKTTLPRTCRGVACCWVGGCNLSSEVSSVWSPPGHGDLSLQ